MVHSAKVEMSPPERVCLTVSHSTREQGGGGGTQAMGAFIFRGLSEHSDAQIILSPELLGSAYFSSPPPFGYGPANETTKEQKLLWALALQSEHTNKQTNKHMFDEQTFPFQVMVRQ